MRREGWDCCIVVVGGRVFGLVGGVGVLLSFLRPLVGERVAEFEIVWLLPRED